MTDNGKNLSTQQSGSGSRWAVAITVLIGGLFLFIWFFSEVFTPSVGLWMGSILWIIVYGFFLGKEFFITVPENQGWVTENILVSEKRPDPRNFGGQRKVHGQRELSTGINPIYPFVEYVVKDGKIDLQKQVDKIDFGGTYRVNDGTDVELKAFVQLQPLPGGLVNYLMYRDRIAEVKEIFSQRVNKFFQQKLLELPPEEAIKIPEWLRSEFEKLFGGENTTDPDEEKTGHWTSTFRIETIKQVGTGKKLAEAPVVLKQINAGIKEMMLKNPELSRDLAAILAAQASGVEPHVDYTHVKFDGLPEGLRELNYGGIGKGGKGVPKNNPGKKGGGNNPKPQP